MLPVNMGYTDNATIVIEKINSNSDENTVVILAQAILSEDV